MPQTPEQRKVSYAKNRERISARQKLYYIENREKIIARVRQYRLNDVAAYNQRTYWDRLDYHKAKFKQYYDKNKETIFANNKKWVAENRQHVNDIKREWRRANPEQLKAANRRAYLKDSLPFKVNARNRKARKRLAPGSYTSKDIAAMLLSQSSRCYWCCILLDNKNYHIDHVYPLSRGGTNWPENLRAACPACNRQKHTMLPLDFAYSLLRA